MNNLRTIHKLGISSAIVLSATGFILWTTVVQVPLSTPLEVSDAEQVSRVVNDISQSFITGKLERVLKTLNNEISFDSKTISAVEFRDSLENTFTRIRSTGSSVFFRLSNQKIEFSSKDRAIVSFSKSDSLSTRNGSIVLTRKAGGWKLSEATDLIAEVDAQMSLALSNSSPTTGSRSVSSQGNSSLFIQQQIFESQRTLIPNTFSDLPTIWKITMAHAEQEFGNRLMANPDDGEVVPIPGDEVAFVLDKAWKRVLYAKTSTQTVKSYGLNTSDFHFLAPSALKALRFPDGNIAVFITDIIHGSLVHLVYNSQTNQLSHYRTITNGLSKPVDVEIDAQGANTTWPNYNIWVADTGLGAILRLNKDGIVTYTLSSYSFPLGGATYTLNVPRRVRIEDDEPGYGSLYLIDGDDNSLVHFTTSNQQPYSFANARHNFGSSSALVSLGSIWNGIVAAADTGLNKLHLFQNSEYLSSFSSFNSTGSVYPSYFSSVNGVQQFNLPMVISHYNSNPTNTIIDAFVGNKWTTNDGFTRFLPGADVVDFRVSFPSGGIQFDYRLTNSSVFSAKIYNQNNAVVWDFNQGSTIASAGYRINAVQWASLGAGLFTFRISALPQNNSSYGQLAQSPVQINYTFSPPVSVSMSGPTTVYHSDPKGTPANCVTWTANVSGGAPPYSYTWSGFLSGTNSSVSNCFSWNGYGGGSYQFNLRVDVSDASNPPKTAFATKTVTAYNSGGGPIQEDAEGEVGQVIPQDFILNNNFPNPFNPETEILFGLPEHSQVTITLTDIQGRNVTTLTSKSYTPGYHRVRWRGRDQYGKQMGSGVYFCRIEAIGQSGSKFTKVLKLSLIK